MTRNDTIKAIMENFSQQLSLYQDMADLSASQLSHLERETNNEKLNQILERRQNLMAVISRLNEENKNLQEQALAELGLGNFILRELRSKIPVWEFEKLQHIITRLSEVLRFINETDGRTQELMRQRGRLTSISGTGQVQAGKLYRQTMEEGRNER